MRHYELGQPLPPPFHTPPGYELCRANFNASFFDLIYWVPPYDPQSIEIWDTCSIKFGIFTAQDIPFFIVDFPDKSWNFDVSLNIHSVQDAHIHSWLNSDGNIITLFLCDCFNNTLLSVRTISIPSESAGRIRTILEKQRKTYENALQTQKQIEKTMDTIITADMIKKTTMRKI